MPHIKRQAEQVMAEFDAAPDGKVIRTQYVLQGNIFRACELASKQKLVLRSCSPMKRATGSGRFCLLIALRRTW
ncbi:hypothetical protein [Aeromonas veronii]|uniref:hypothetical protein n=1 Tax=Aeromonas veronii TaxID=654 RepID=UPI001F0A09AA|nr:hypothetical protein [Aeromonas veronii]